MRLTLAQRRAAVHLAELVTSGSEADRTGQDLLAQTVLDCRDIFVRMAPVFHAAMQFVTERGVSDYRHWDELRAAVQEARRAEREAA